MSDRRLLLALFGAVLLLIVGVSVLVPRASEDGRPVIANTGAHGAKAALLTLQSMGHPARVWDQPSTQLAGLDAAHSTLVLAEPPVEKKDKIALAKALGAYLKRGGRVLATGEAAASLLPGGKADVPGKFSPSLCNTVPEGAGPLAAAGPLEMAYEGSWSAEGPQFRVEQRCLAQPVVVRFPVGAGEAVWWSSATPLTNAGLKNDGNLKLLLASVGEGRAVYFDEFYFGAHEGQEESPLRGLPLWWMFAQFVLLCVLLVLSFSRRKGPLRLPVVLPRSSPVEFAESMGGLYGKARATEAAVDAARRRMERVLSVEAGLSRDAVRAEPEAIAEALTARFGGDWAGLAGRLREARAGGERVSPGDALALVRGLAEDEERLRAAVSGGLARRAPKAEDDALQEPARLAAEMSAG